MSSLRGAWRAFRSRPRAERVQLLRRVLARLKSDGVAATVDWARAGGAAARRPDCYAEWIRQHIPDAGGLAAMRSASQTLRYQPLISIITAAFNTAPAWLDEAAESVLAQAYPNWEWHVADDGSTAEPTIAALDRLKSRDPRIHVHRAATNGGIASASNLALAHARGEFVALMDHDDALVPHALFRLAECLNDVDPPPDVVYSDEDKLDLDGRRCDPYFKPDWSPDLFRSSMYACHLLLIRRALVEAVGGFRSKFDFSQDFDLLLRVVERTARVAHVPDVLYHWRKTPASTAMAGEAKPAAHGAGALALQAHLDRQGIAGRILDAGAPGLYRVQYVVQDAPLVSIVMPVRDSEGGLVSECLEAIEANTAYRAREIVLVSATGRLPPRLPAGSQAIAVQAVGPFNFARWVNAGACLARGAHLLVLHDDVRPRDPGWLEAMLELSAQHWIGAVGAKLFDSRGALQHIGLVAGLGGLAASPFRGHSATTVGYYSSANCIRNYSAVSAACLMTRRGVFDRLGGFDERLSGMGVDLDYGLKVNAAGLRVVFTPYARLTHQESSGVSGSAPSPAELAHLRQRWGSRLDRDPYYNPHLSVRARDYRLRLDDASE